MKRCTIFANCQSDGLVHFLRKTPMGEQFTFNIQHNWQIIMLEQPLDGLFEAARNCDLFIYQPTRAFDIHDGGQGPSTDDLIRDYVPKAAKKISFSYIYNDGFFPFMKIGKGPDGWITGEHVMQLARDERYAQLIDEYDRGVLNFECGRRVLRCLIEQSRREQTTDIKLVPFLLREMCKERLFLTQNHPTSAVFVELAHQVYYGVFGDLAPDINYQDENEANMNGVMGASVFAARELGLEWPATDGADQYYRQFLYEFIDAHKEHKK